MNNLTEQNSLEKQMSPKQQERFFKIGFLLFFATAFSFATSLLSFFVHSWIILGYAPNYDHPDPKELPIYTIYSPIIELTGNVWIFSFPVLLIFAMFYSGKRTININWKWIASAFFMHLISFVVFCFLFEWYLD